jgi:hypothetical protein
MDASPKFYTAVWLEHLDSWDFDTHSKKRGASHMEESTVIRAAKGTIGEARFAKR